MSEIDRRPLSKVKNTAGYCLKWINLMQTRAKIDAILSGHGGKPGTYYRDLEPGNELWNRVWVPGSCYKLLFMTVLVPSMHLPDLIMLVNQRTLIEKIKQHTCIYLGRVVNNEWSKCINRYNPRRYGCTKAFTKKWTKRYILPLLYVTSCNPQQQLLLLLTLQPHKQQLQYRSNIVYSLPNNNKTATTITLLLLLLLQPFYGPLDFVWDYPGEPAPVR